SGVIYVFTPGTFGSVIEKCERCRGSGVIDTYITNPFFDPDIPTFDDTVEGQYRMRLYLWRREIGKGMATDEDRPPPPPDLPPDRYDYYMQPFRRHENKQVDIQDFRDRFSRIVKKDEEE